MSKKFSLLSVAISIAILILPGISVSAQTPTPDPYLSQPLCFEAIDGEMTVAFVKSDKNIRPDDWDEEDIWLDGRDPFTIPSNYHLEYSTNNGTTWSSWPVPSMYYGEGDRPVVTISSGQKLLVRASSHNSVFNSSTTSYGFRVHGANCNLSGNIMSLVDPDFEDLTTIPTAYYFNNVFCKGDGSVSAYDIPTTFIYADNLRLPATTLTDGCYANMFANNWELSTIYSSLLPATTLAEHCYDHMFFDCEYLTNAVSLPATTMVTSCYQYMFAQCAILTTAPELPSTTLAPYCYDNMFAGDFELAAAPELPATTLAKNCYSNMFWACEGLTSIPELPATTLAESCYEYMFYSSRSHPSGYLKLPATTLAKNCYAYMFATSTIDYLEVSFLDWNNGLYTDGWLWVWQNKAGTLECPFALPLRPESDRGYGYGYSYIPTTWKIKTKIGSDEVGVARADHENDSYGMLEIHGENYELGQVVPNEYSISVSDSVILRRTFSDDKFYYFSLPFDCPWSAFDVFDGNTSVKSLYSISDGTTTDFDNKYVIFKFDEAEFADGARDEDAFVYDMTSLQSNGFKAGVVYAVGVVTPEDAEDGDVTSLDFIFAKTGATTISTSMTASIDVESSGSDASSGWNMIGNPFYSPVSSDAFTGVTSFYTVKEKIAANGSYYDIESHYVGEGGETVNIDPTTPIYVQVPASTTSLSVSYSAPASSSSKLPADNGSVKANPVVRLSLAQGGEEIDKAYIVGNDDSGDFYAVGEDCYKIRSANHANIFTIVDGSVETFVNAVELSEIVRTVPVGFSTQKAGSYTIACDAAEGCHVALVNLTNGTRQDITAAEATVVLGKGDTKGQYSIEISYAPSEVTGVADAENDGIEVYVENGFLRVDNASEDAAIVVYDAAGKSLGYNNGMLLANGVYFVKINGVTYKIVR